MTLGACRSLALCFEDMNIQGVLGRESRMGSLLQQLLPNHFCRQANLHHSRKSRGLSKSEQEWRWSPTRVQPFMLPKKCLSPSTGEHITLGILVSTVGALCFSSIDKKHPFPSHPDVFFCRAGLGCEAAELAVAHRTMWPCPHGWLPGLHVSSQPSLAS